MGVNYEKELLPVVHSGLMINLEKPEWRTGKRMKVRYVSSNLCGSYGSLLGDVLWVSGITENWTWARKKYCKCCWEELLGLWGFTKRPSTWRIGLDLEQGTRQLGCSRTKNKYDSYVQKLIDYWFAVLLDSNLLSYCVFLEIIKMFSQI